MAEYPSNLTSAGVLAAIPSGTYAVGDRPSTLPVGTTLAHRYNPHQALYNFRPSNTRKARNGMAKMRNGEGPMRTCCVGDSITFGSLGTPKEYSAGWVGLLQTRMASLWPSGSGTGVVHLINNNLSSDDRIVKSAGWTLLSGRGAFNEGVFWSATVGSTITFTANCDNFNVYGLKGSGGTYSTSIDGGAATNHVVPSGGEAWHTVQSHSAGSAGSHTLTITVVSGTVYIGGVEGTTGSGGVLVTRMGRSGHYLDPNLSTSISAPGTASTSNALSAATSVAPADLYIVGDCTNEYLQQTSIANFTSRANTLVTALQAVGTVIWTTAPQSSNTSNTIPWSSYVQAIYGLADTLDFPVIDTSERWGLYTVSNPLGWNGDGNHPSNRGHYEIMGAVAAVIGLLAA